MSCSVCHSSFTSPKTLYCGHSFCMDCIFDGDGYPKFNNCPLCRAIVPARHHSLVAITAYDLEHLPEASSTAMLSSKQFENMLERQVSESPVWEEGFVTNISSSSAVNLLRNSHLNLAQVIIIEDTVLGILTDGTYIGPPDLSLDYTQELGLEEDFGSIECMAVYEDMHIVKYAKSFSGTDIPASLVVSICSQTPEDMKISKIMKKVIVFGRESWFALYTDGTYRCSCLPESLSAYLVGNFVFNKVTDIAISPQGQWYVQLKGGHFETSENLGWLKEVLYLLACSKCDVTSVSITNSKYVVLYK